MVHVPHYAYAIAHMFCASRDDPRSSDLLRTVPTNSKVMSMQFVQEKEILARSIENKKRKLG